MINLSRVLSDPRIAQQKPFTVYRKSGSWQSGEWIPSETPIQINGIITPASAKDLTQIPEGDRTGGEITILSIEPLYVTHADNANNTTPGTSDEVLWNNERYRIFNVFPWSDFGFYHAIAIRMISK
jgi:hypothetical protein